MEEGSGSSVVPSLFLGTLWTAFCGVSIAVGRRDEEWEGWGKAGMWGISSHQYRLPNTDCLEMVMDALALLPVMMCPLPWGNPSEPEPGVQVRDRWAGTTSFPCLSHEEAMHIGRPCSPLGLLPLMYLHCCTGRDSPLHKREWRIRLLVLNYVIPWCFSNTVEHPALF